MTTSGLSFPANSGDAKSMACNQANAPKIAETAVCVGINPLNVVQVHNEFDRLVITCSLQAVISTASGALGAVLGGGSNMTTTASSLMGR